MNKSIKQRGFTLIELLVVIAIIGVLTTLITSNLTQAQARARDARRISDLNVIAQGLEMYYSQNNQYPGYGNNTGQFSFAISSLTDSSGEQYIKNIPKDPTNNTTYQYYYCTTTTGSRITRFNLFAKFENANEKEKYCRTASWSATGCEFATTDTVTCSQGSSGSGAAPSYGAPFLSTVDYVVTDP